MFVERKIDSLYGLIVVGRVEESPVMLHCATFPRKKNKLEVEQYVQLSVLPIELQSHIREVVSELFASGKGEGGQALETRMEFQKIKDEERQMEMENDELRNDVGAIEKRVTSG